MTLVLDNISLSFGGIKALSDVSFSLEPEKINGLIGPNGAGKTTLFNIITRFYNQDEGNVIFDTKNINKYKSHQLAKLGMTRTFQNINLFDSLTLYDNLLLSYPFTGKYLFFQTIGINKNRNNKILKEVDEMIEFLEVEKYKDYKVSELPLGVQKLTEIGRALILNPKLLLLDEPAAGLNTVETELLSKKLTQINDEYKTTMLLVEHDMSLVMNICQNLVVIDFGKKIAEGTPNEILNNQLVINAYLGSEEND